MLVPSLTHVLICLYYVTLSLLALFGAHRAALLFLYRRHRRTLEKPRMPAELPHVTVQLPIYNEMYVATRLLDAVCGLDYPRDRLSVQVLDDSDDETSERLRLCVEGWRERGVAVEHLRRTERDGFKAGALAAGLATAPGELIAVFDADFVPRSDFLLHTVPWFEDDDVGMVQARWDHINRGFSLLTRIQAVLLDGHFRIEHAARFWSGRFFNFNGTAGVWRRRAIEDAGGWQHDTLTEDLDLSYRAQLAGWKFVYLADTGVPAELPVDIASFKTQQYRWAKGAAQTCRKLARTIGRSSASPIRKLEALIHLTTNTSYVLMVLFSVLVFPTLLVRSGATPGLLLLVDLPLFLSATVAVVGYYVAGQFTSRERDPRLLELMPFVLSLGIGLSINNARAVLSGFFKKGGRFERTPKYRIESSRDGWRKKRYRAGISTTFFAEGVFVVYFAVAFVVAARLGYWWSLPFLGLFLQGYAYVFLLSAAAFLRGRRKPHGRAPEPTPLIS